MENRLENGLAPIHWKVVLYLHTYVGKGIINFSLNRRGKRRVQLLCIFPCQGQVPITAGWTEAMWVKFLAQQQKAPSGDWTRILWITSWHQTTATAAPQIIDLFCWYNSDNNKNIASFIACNNTLKAYYYIPAALKLSQFVGTSHSIWRSWLSIAT